MNYVIPEACIAALCILAEARGEPFDGQVAVGNILRNRARLRYQSDGTIHGTVTHPLAFSWMNAHDPQRTRVLRCSADDPAYHSAVKAWEESGRRNVVPLDAVLYYAPEEMRPRGSRPRWNFDVLEEVARLGGHVFYRERGILR